MPAQRPRASFDPVSPDFDLDALVEQTPNFQLVNRISCDTIEKQGMEAFDRLVQLYVVVGGKPLVIDGYQSHLDPWTFSSKWLQDNRGDRVENARDLRKEHLYTPLTIGHYIKNMGKLAEQFFERPHNYRELDRQRVYLKDIDCPEVWHDKLKEHLPPNLFYLNETTGEPGGPGAADEVIPTGGRRKGKGIAPAGDLMSSLPPPMRAENMMCYIGHEGTYTPAHREMCASLGHNIMVETSDVLGDDGKPERPGSSIWFMTETKDRHMVSEYWLSVLGHDIEVEKHFAQVAAWKKAPFTTYVVEQRAGDFILIPPLAPHQVWNRGTRTMKAAWNRTTVETLEMAMSEALPNARMVCRDEQYKNKAIVFFTLQKYSDLLARAKDQEQTAPSLQEANSLRTSARIKQLRKDFKRLFNLYKEILLSEMFSPDSSSERNVQFIPFESNVTCSYCRGNIFNRFLSCENCQHTLGTPDAEPYDICMECYAMGRSCKCISKLRWTEQFKWKELMQKYEQWRRQFLEIDGGVAKTGSPLPIQEERQQLTKKTLAQICQEQLKRRPFVDVSKDRGKQNQDSDEEEEIQVNEDGTVKKTKKRRSEAWLKNHHACHVCAHRHEKWKMAECKCGKWWCYGTLFRGHDLYPQEIMEDPSWQCPHCKGCCNAGSCRKDPRQTPYEPKGTLLGHDTKKVADVRSVESLVDFSVSNIGWLKEPTQEAPADNARLRQRQEEAALNKLDDPFDHHDGSGVEMSRDGIQYLPDSDESQIEPHTTDNSLIDPSLRETGTTGFVSVNRPNTSKTGPVSQLLNAEQNDLASAAYEAATQSGYIAPSAVMFRSSYDYDEPTAAEDAETTMDTDAAIAFNTTGSKRSRKSDTATDTRISVKSRRVEENMDDKTLPGANKRYRKEKERQALDEAKKNGRYILTHAKLRGKSKIAKLPIGRNMMAKFSASAGTAAKPSNNDLLKSDVAADEPQIQQQKQVPVADTAKSTKAVRIRVEKDDDFGARKRNRKQTSATGPASGKNNSGAIFEEVELGSDSDEHNEPPSQMDGVLENIGSGRKHRRTSTWQSKRHKDDDEELPEELPDDWKDGQVSRNRGRVAGETAKISPSSAKSTPKTAGKSVAQIRPGGSAKGRPGTARRGGAIVGAKHKNKGNAVPDSEERRATNGQLTEIAIVQNKVHENGIDNDGDNADDDDDNEEDSMLGVKPVATMLSRAVRAVTSGSVLTKQSPSKNAKVVGTSGKRAS